MVLLLLFLLIFSSKYEFIITSIAMNGTIMIYLVLINNRTTCITMTFLIVIIVFVTLRFTAFDFFLVNPPFAILILISKSIQMIC